MQESATLRSLDRYLGTAACAALSALHRVSRTKADPPPAKKILLVELFEMGAAVMMIPTIRLIREQYPDAQIYCLTSSTCLPIWEKIEGIEKDKIYAMRADSSLNFVVSFFKTILQLRKLKFDYIIDFELFMRISALAVGMLRANRRCGFHRYDHEGLYRGSFYDRACSYNQNAHISKNFLALAKAAFGDGLQTAHDHPALKNAIDPRHLLFPPYLSTNDRQLAQRLFEEPQLKDYILVCPDVGPTLSVRNYPLQALAQFIDLFQKQYPNHRIGLIGTRDNSLSAQKVISHLADKTRSVDLCGKTSFRELLDLIAGASLLVTNDNGPAHFATLTGTKTLSIFSTDSPFIYGPLGNAVIAYSHFHCSPCISAFNHKKTRCIDNKCLQAIDPGTLMTLAGALLSGSARLRSINNQIPYLF